MIVRGHLKLLVLNELDNESMTGYRLMTHLEKEIGRKPSSGSIYPLLDNLLSKKLVTVKKKDNKKIYSISKKGKDFIKEIDANRQQILDRILKVHELLDSPASKHAHVMKLFHENKCGVGILEKEINDLAVVLLEKTKNKKNIPNIKKILKSTSQEIKSL